MRTAAIIMIALLYAACREPSKPVEQTTLSFHVIGTDTAGGTENISLLIPTGSHTKEELEAFALARQAALCKGLCNVHLYDDSLAYVLNLDMLAIQRKSMSSAANQAAREELDTFVEANYKFITDHFIGTLVGKPQQLWYYPYKDLGQIE